MAGDGYSRELCRVVCGQLAELAGYEAVQESAVEVLGELLAKYITELAASSHGYAELAQRTQLNVNDVLLALDDLGTSVPELQTYLASLTPVSAARGAGPGGARASQRSRMQQLRDGGACTHARTRMRTHTPLPQGAAACALCAWRDMHTCIHAARSPQPPRLPPAHAAPAAPARQEDNTFAHPLTQYPIQKPGRALPSFLDKREAPPPHIPPFLPAFPDKHTYVQTPKFPGHEEDPAKQTQARWLLRGWRGTGVRTRACAAASCRTVHAMMACACWRCSLEQSCSGTHPAACRAVRRTVHRAGRAAGAAAGGEGAGQAARGPHAPNGHAACSRDSSGGGGRGGGALWAKGRGRGGSG